VAVPANYPVASDPRYGRVVAGRYTIVGRIGSGASGTVYRATEEPSGRDIALKILHPDRAVDADARARFLREARTMSRLSSPHTVKVIDFGEAEGGDLFIAMELLEGESLADRLRRAGRFDVGTAFDAIRQALQALAEAHAKGVIHRDLKPANLFFARTPDGSNEEIVKVLDFGVAKLIASPLPSDMGQTLSGTVLGTPCYMSPEQALGRPLDARSDLYSLGVIAYELLAGRPPFIEETNLLVMASHVRTAPPPLRGIAPEVDVTPEVEAALLRVLAKDPGRRPASAEDMARVLERAQAAHRTVVSGVRPALSHRWRSALESAFGGPPQRGRPAARRSDATIRTRAVTTRGREARSVALIALAITAMALWMWTRGLPSPRRATEISKDSAAAVKANANGMQR
jgi:serine/threonine-protein kinase